MIRLLVLNSSVQGESLSDIIDKDYFNFEFDVLDNTYFLIPDSCTNDELEVRLIRNNQTISKLSAYFIEENEYGEGLYDLDIDGKSEENLSYTQIYNAIQDWVFSFFNSIGFDEEEEEKSFHQGAYNLDVRDYLANIYAKIVDAPDSHEEDLIRDYCVETIKGMPGVLDYCINQVLNSIKTWLDDGNDVWYCSVNRKMVPESRISFLTISIQGTILTITPHCDVKTVIKDIDIDLRNCVSDLFGKSRGDYEDFEVYCIGFTAWTCYKSRNNGNFRPDGESILKQLDIEYRGRKRIMYQIIKDMKKELQDEFMMNFEAKNL